jgi:hypothetical protein
MNTAWRRIATTSVAFALMAAACNPQQPESAPEAPPPTTPEAPRIPQAKWKMVAYQSGSLGELSNKEKKRLKNQKPRVRKFVREVYAALFLDPSTIDSVVAEMFTRRAGRALKRSGAGFRPGAEKIKTLMRKATIGIQADNAALAAAEVNVRARAMANNDVVRLRHQSTLWMERKNGRWRVIAFKVDQERVT